MANVLVYGAGAVGQYIGGMLIKCGHSVVMVGRPRFCDVFEKGNLRIKRPAGEEQIKQPFFIDLTGKIPNNFKLDWIIFTVGSYDLNHAVMNIRSILKKRRIGFLLLQSGVGSHKHTSGILPENDMFIGSLSASLAISEPGTVIQMDRKTDLYLAPLRADNDTTNLQKLFVHFPKSGINIRCFQDWQAMKWSALLFEIFANAQCALVECSPKEILQNENLFKLEILSILEGIKLMEDMELEIIDYPSCPVKKILNLNNMPDIIKRFFLKRETNGDLGHRIPTIKNCLMKNKPVCEVEFLNGAVSLYGKMRRVPTPANDFLTSETRKIFLDRDNWKKFRKKPEEVFRTFQNFADQYEFLFNRVPVV